MVEQIPTLPPVEEPCVRAAGCALKEAASHGELTQEQMFPEALQSMGGPRLEQEKEVRRKWQRGAGMDRLQSLFLIPLEPFVGDETRVKQ